MRKLCERVRPVAGRGLLRRPRAPPMRDGRQVGTFGDRGHPQLLSRPPHHHWAKAGRCSPATRVPAPPGQRHSATGAATASARPAVDNTRQCALGWNMGDLPRGLRNHKYHLRASSASTWKITDMQASVGLAQMDQFCEELRSVAARQLQLRSALEGGAGRPAGGGVRCCPSATLEQRPGLVRLPAHRRARRRPPQPQRAGRAIWNERQDRHAPAVRRQPGAPALHGRPNLRIAGGLTVADAIMRATFWIGVYPGLGADHIAYILDILHGFCRLRLRLRPDPSARKPMPKLNAPSPTAGCRRSRQQPVLCDRHSNTRN